MPIDINLLRTDRGGNPEQVRASEKKRGESGESVDKVLQLDEEWKKLRFRLDAKNKEKNALQKEIGKLKKAKQDAEAVIAERSQVMKEVSELEKLEREKEDELHGVLGTIGNMIHRDVPVSIDEKDNPVLRTWNPSPDPLAGKRDDGDTVYSHHDIMRCIGGYDQDRGTKTAGDHGYFLNDVGVDLAFALINYGLSFLRKRQYKKIMPPYLVVPQCMAKAAQLSQFDEELYKVVTSSQSADDKYLIATSEQPLTIYHMNEWIEESALPIKYAGYSTCFRKEAGGHGKETWGLFRVHQFEKVEQFCITTPEESWEMFESMLSTSEDFYKSLGIPFQIVQIVSGALNNAAAMKCDLEAWFPFQKEFKELVSCSNCTDYSARALEVRCGSKKMGEREKRYVHMLNATLVAVERTMCAVVENYQGRKVEGEGDQQNVVRGVWVPEVLVPFMEGQTFLPFLVDPEKKKKK